MNVVVDIRCLTQKYRTGVGEYTTELLNSLFKLDTKNQYFLFYNSFEDVSDVVPKWEQKNVHYVVTRWPSKVLNFLIWLGVIKLDKFVQRKITMEQWDNGTIDYFFAPNLNFIHLSKHVKFILTIHDLTFEFFPECYSFKRRLWHRIVNPRKLCERADIIITPSDNTKHDIIFEYEIHGNNIHRVYPGLSSLFIQKNDMDEKYIKQKYGLPDDYVLCIGTLEPRKNVDFLLDAYENLTQKDKQVTLVIAGPKGWRYKKLLHRIDHMAGVIYIGYIDEVDKQAVYKNSRAFVFPSIYEGFGFPVLEAMSCGVPVITSDRASLPEVVGNAAYMVSAYHVSALSQAMHLVLNTSSLCDKLIKLGEEKSGQFRWEKTAQEFLKCIKFS